MVKILMPQNKPNYIVRATTAEYIARWNPEHEPDLPDIFEVEKMRKLRDFKSMDIKKIRDVLQASVTRSQQLRAYFKVPDQKILSEMNLHPASTPNQAVAIFINFLLLMIEAIVHRESCCTYGKRFSIENLRTELGFLITFLGDTAMHLQLIHTKNIMLDIGNVVNQVGRFIFSYVFTLSLHMAVISTVEDDWRSNEAHIDAMRNEVGIFLHLILYQSFEDMQLQTSKVEDIDDTTIEIEYLVHEVQSFIDFFLDTENDQVQEAGILDLALSNLSPKFELLNKKIMMHCVVVSKMPSNTMAPNTVMVSLFIVDSVLDDLMYLINNKSCKTDGVDTQIVRLHEELKLLGSSVNELAQQHLPEHEQFIIRTRDIAHEVEFIINPLPPVWYLALRLPQLIQKIQFITMDIIKIKRQTDVVEDKKLAKYPKEQALSPSKQTPPLEDNIVGFRQVSKEIMEQLLGGTQCRQIISMFGMPGLGKTTLASKLYNHPFVVKHFDCRAWCVSSQTYNKRNMLIDILMSLGHLKTEDIKHIKEDEDLGGKVYKFIKARRYLLVIDDIWDANVWDDVKRYFPDDGTGSRILFTSRNKEVGSEASASVMIELPFLSDAQCWELLQQKVFRSKNCPRELLDTGKKIATTCQGLPLAVVVIAGVLATMEKKEHLWEAFESNLGLHISEKEDYCMQILELSYRHLPIHLKPCFLYFGAFKEDKEIPVQTLMSIWSAEGFIKKEEGKNLEDLALEYLMKLIDRGLVLVSKRRSNGQVKACKIHDLLLDMCLRIAKENDFLKNVKYSDRDGALYQQHHCHRLLWEKFSNYIPPFCLHVRSLLCGDAVLPMLFSCSFKVLKVFHFVKTKKHHLAIGIEHLVQLRYLAIQLEIEALRIQKCHRLEFLEVYNRDEGEITEDLLNMVNLRCIHFRRGARFSESCRRQATNEESFQINNKVLRSISVVKILDEIDEKILRCFPNLRRLKAKLQGSINCSLDFLYQLESLKLETRSSFSFISLPSNVKYLTLVDGCISPKQMEMIERLESLEVLKLYGVQFEGEQWNTSGFAFPQLTVLKLYSVKISEWNASSDTFSSLQQLVLQGCGSLEGIPSGFGDISTLQKIELIGCPKSVKQSAKEIENYQKEMGNEELQVIESYN